MPHNDAVRPVVAWIRRQLARSSVVIVAVAAFAIGLACAPGTSNQNATNGNAPANTNAGGGQSQVMGTFVTDWTPPFTPNFPGTLRIEWDDTGGDPTKLYYKLGVKKNDVEILQSPFDSKDGPRDVDLEAGKSYKVQLTVYNGTDFDMWYSATKVKTTSSGKKIFTAHLVPIPRREVRTDGTIDVFGTTFATPVGIVMIEK